MFKVALLAAALLVAAPTAMAVNADALPAGDTPCHAVQSLDPGCTTRVIDANGDGTISAAELASFSASQPAAPDWAALHPPRSTGLDFKDAAVEPSSMLSGASGATSRRLIPALFALGALLLLLRRRPT